MADRWKRAAATRRFYAWEGSPMVPKGADTPMAKLRALARRAWRENTRRKFRLKIVAGRGIMQAGRLLSYQQDDRIVLARDQRYPLILLHELAHALVPEDERQGDHGPKFCAIYNTLVIRYAHRL